MGYLSICVPDHQEHNSAGENTTLYNCCLFPNVYSQQYRFFSGNSTKCTEKAASSIKGQVPFCRLHSVTTFSIRFSFQLMHVELFALLACPYNYLWPQEKKKLWSFIRGHSNVQAMVQLLNLMYPFPLPKVETLSCWGNHFARNDEWNSACTYKTQKDFLAKSFLFWITSF